MNIETQSATNDDSTKAQQPQRLEDSAITVDTECGNHSAPTNQLSARDQLTLTSSGNFTSVLKNGEQVGVVYKKTDGKPGRNPVITFDAFIETHSASGASTNLRTDTFNTLMDALCFVTGDE